MEPVIVGISGGSASGKTTLARQLVEHYEDKSLILSLDCYYKGQYGSDVDISKLNFDSPESLDMELFQSHLKAIHRGEAILIPQYDFATHARMNKKIMFHPTPIVIIEGIFLFNVLGIADFNLKVFVDVPDDIRLIRRLIRDGLERSRSVDSVITQYLSSVRPMHYKYVLPDKSMADLVIDGELIDEKRQLSTLIESIDRLIK
ncbi:MAG: uridine kinase [Bacteroidales bacterium]|nr:uridine kinase [Bacteroidales bacterium]MBN2818295.1 uridine kinase [Bacteroidales bacterium]